MSPRSRWTEHGVLQSARFEPSPTVRIVKSIRMAGMPTFTPDLIRYRWYDDDGGEAASTPLAAENTAPDITITADRIVHLRVQVHETGGASGASTDDWGVQFRLNGVGGYTDITAATTGVQSAAGGSQLSDGSATTNRGTNGLNDPSGSFVAGEQEDGNGVVEDSLLTASNFTEHVFALKLIYADLADNDSIGIRVTLNGGNPGMGVTVEATATINKPAAFTPAFDAFRFYFDGTEAGSTPYCIEGESPEVDMTAEENRKLHLRVRVQETAGGAGASTDDWQLQVAKDGGGYVNVTAASSNVRADTGSQLTDGSATTNRANGLSDGSGTFVAGEQEEGNGQIEDHQLTASNFTEHVFALLLIAADLANGATLDFRLTLNGGTPGMTNSVTPRLTIAKKSVVSVDYRGRIPIAPRGTARVGIAPQPGNRPLSAPGRPGPLAGGLQRFNPQRFRFEREIAIEGVFVTPAAAIARALGVDPAIVLGSTSVTPAAAIARALGIDPTVVLGSMTVTPAAAIARALAVDPAVIYGSITTTPAAAAARALGVDPALIFGSTSVAPAAALARALAVDPVVVLGSLVIAPAFAAARALGVDPAVIFGSVSVTPAAAAARALGVDPTLIFGSTSVVPAAAAARALGVDPNVIAGGDITVTPAFAAARALGVNPLVILGSISLTPAQAAARALAVDPVTVLGSTSVVPAQAIARALGVDPAIILGSTTSTPNAAVARALGVDPTVLGGGVLVVPAAAIARALGVDPTVVLGSLAVAPAQAVARALAVDPTTVLGSTSTTPAAAALRALAVDPNVVLGSMVVAPTAALSRALATAPSITLGAVTVVPAPGVARALGVDPAVILGATLVVPSAASARALGIDPLVILVGEELWKLLDVTMAQAYASGATAEQATLAALQLLQAYLSDVTNV